MEIVRLKHVKRYRVGGKVYWYHRVTKERLPDNGRARAKRVLEINDTLDGWRPGTIPGSLGDVITRYQAAPEFTRLAPATKKSYARYLDLLSRTVPNVAVAKIDAAWIYGARDAMADAPRSADLMLSVLSIVLGFAVTRGFRTDNPAGQVKKLRGGKHYEPWPDQAIERFRAEADPRLVWAMELAVYTGQRRADILAMQWRHIDAGTIAVAQRKTGVRLVIPIHPQLAEVLDGIPRVGVTIVHRRDGRAYTGEGFASHFQREKRRLGLGDLQFHGLRHTAATRLAEAGCTDREIMSILGHRTASMVTRYTAGAEQKRLSRSAMGKVVQLETGTRREDLS